MAQEDCDAVATSHFANVLNPRVRLDRNPFGPNDFCKCVSGRDELRGDNPLRPSFRDGPNPLLHEPLVVGEIAGPRSKVEERNTEHFAGSPPRLSSLRSLKRRAAGRRSSVEEDED